MFVNLTFTEVAKNRPMIIREHAERTQEFRDALLEKAANVEHGALNINKTREEMDELLLEVDSALGNVEEELSLHTEGKYNDGQLYATIYFS